MAAKKNNKYAEKWQKVDVLNHLNNIYDDVHDNKVFYLGVALANADLYDDIWQYWIRKFGSDNDVFRLIKRIDAKIEANLVTRLLSNQSNAAGVIFILKNKHRMADKQEIDHTSKGESITPTINIINPNG
jgi:hypothetical protein